MDVTPSLILNVVTLLGLLVVGPRAFKVASLRAQLKAKDEVIATHVQNKDALTDRLDVLEAEIAELRESAAEDRRKITELERDLADSRARYEEMQRYAAPEALAAVSTQMTEIVGESRKVWDARWATMEDALRDVHSVLERIDGTRGLSRRDGA